MEISITRGLKELKLLDAKIEKSMEGVVFVDVEQKKYGKKALNTNQTADEFSVQSISSFQKIKDLIKRRNAIKSAIIKANATTEMTVAKRTMTIAEAIVEKHMIVYQQKLLHLLKQQNENVNKSIINARVQLDEELARMIDRTLGKDRKVSKEDYNAIAVPFIEANELKKIDPIGIGARILELEQFIVDFTTDIDIVLSEINAKTMISIPD